MVVHPKAGPAGDLAHDRAQSRIVDLGRPTAARADDVMVMDRLAAYVRMRTARQVEPLHGAQIRQDLERPEDRRPADADPMRAGVRDEVGRREVPSPPGDEADDRATGVCEPVSGTFEGGEQGGGVGHYQMIPSLKSSVQIGSLPRSTDERRRSCHYRTTEVPDGA